MNKPDEALSALIQRWREDQRAFYHEIAEKFRVLVPEVRVEQILDDAEINVHKILLLGLDIGTIVEYLIPVTLRKHSEHGWVFVSDDNTMYKVRDRV